ncbi:MAG: leucine-rich repeat protein [Clostridia bacterium]|nr:leucine-rich repeat protein [Clostridia bacterium]
MFFNRSIGSFLEIDGKTVTSIGSGAFYDCTSLTSITIPDSVTSIGNGVFRGCTSLTSSVLHKQ